MVQLFVHGKQGVQVLLKKKFQTLLYLLCSYYSSDLAAKEAMTIAKPFQSARRDTRLGSLFWETVAYQEIIGAIRYEKVTSEEQQ